MNRYGHIDLGAWCPPGKLIIYGLCDKSLFPGVMIYGFHLQKVDSIQISYVRSILIHGRQKREEIGKL